MKWPANLTGQVPLAAWLNALLFSAKSCQLRKGVGYRIVSQSETGTVIAIDQAVGGGIKWQEPFKELDPTLSVQKNTLVYITTNNALVTTGYTDLQLMVNQLACEGIWCAAKDVPATNGGNYNVPTFPYPSATGTPTGSPGSLKGDLDGDDTYDIYWIYLGQMNCA